MATALKSKAWTCKDYPGFPEGGPLRHEVIDGELYMTPSPNTRHPEIIERLLRKIGHFPEENPIGKSLSLPMTWCLRAIRSRAFPTWSWRFSPKGR